MRSLIFTAVVVVFAAAVGFGCKSSTKKRNSPPPPPPTRSSSDSTDSTEPPPPRRAPPPPSRTERPPPPPRVVDCGGPRTSFDSDGDGISDPVERNNGENSYADLATGRCDRDPSRPVGPPNNGRIEGALNLPDSGSGYRHYLGTDRVDTDDWGTLTILGCVEAVGREMARQGVDIGVGDLSLREGGAFPPHVSHQNGLDADLRYVRRDRQHRPLDLRFQPDEYDLEATQAVFETFFRLCDVQVIFVDIDRIGFVVSGQEDRLVHVSGHANHYHVRVNGGSR